MSYNFWNYFTGSGERTSTESTGNSFLTNFRYIYKLKNVWVRHGVPLVHSGSVAIELDNAFDYATGVTTEWVNSRQKSNLSSFCKMPDSW